MTHGIRIHETGGPEVLRWEEIDVPAPGPDEARVRQTAAGLNFIDVYHRTGLYPLELPSTIGMEGAGVVEEVGDHVKDLKAGDRVAYADLPVGAYAEARVMPAHRLVPLPDSISNEQAAGMMLHGMTAEYLIRRTYKVEPGQTVLVHAAAGGVGLIACQWLKMLGATVIGTVGSDAKAELARAHGCDHRSSIRVRILLAASSISQMGTAFLWSMTRLERTPLKVCSIVSLRVECLSFLAILPVPYLISIRAFSRKRARTI
jgi:NADPH:quinone reductase